MNSQSDPAAEYKQVAARLNLNQLHVFREVAIRRSFTAAADALSLSQPAVSLQVRSLEQFLGVRLLERSHSGVVLTDAGKELLTAAMTVFETLERVEASFAQTRLARRGQVLVGAGTTAGMYIAPEIIAAFRSAESGVQVSLQIDDAERLYDQLAHNLIDIAIVGGPADAKRFMVHRLCPDAIVLVAHPDHPLAAKGAVALADIAQRELVFAHPGPRTRAFVDEVFRKAGLTFRPRLVVAGTEATKKVVEASLGLGLITAFAVSRELAAGTLREVVITDGAFTRDFELLTLRGHSQRPAVESFVRFASEFSSTHFLPFWRRSISSDK